MPDRQRGRKREDRIAVVHDDKRRVLVLADSQLEMPEAHIFDEPTRCYRINHEWSAIVMGFIGWLAHPSQWSDATDWTFPAISQINQMRVGVPCMNFQLRQSTENHCHLEQSFDGGETWSLAFDYSLCIDENRLTQSLSDILRAMQDTEDAYDGTAESIAPDSLPDGTSLDNIRRIALCALCQWWVIGYCEMELRLRNELSGVLGVLARIVQLVQGLTGIIPLSSDSEMLQQMAQRISQLAGSPLGAVPTADLENDDARMEVACCMYNGMDIVGFDYDQFQDSLDGCGFTPATPEANIRDALAPLLNDLDEWLYFLSDYEDAFLFAKDGLVDCSCPDPNLVILEALQITEQLSPALIQWGVFNEVSFGVDDEQISGSTLGCRVYFEIPVGSTVLYAKMLYNVDSNGEERENRILDGVDGTGITLIAETPTANQEHLNRVLEFDGSYVMTNDRVQFSINANVATNSYAGLKEIIVHYIPPE